MPRANADSSWTDGGLLTHMQGLSLQAKWIGKDGFRSTAARSYIYNKPRPNLTILSRKTVMRVLLEGGTAHGVEICDAPTTRADVEVKNVMTVRARKQVVVCAGALGTPAILERSGIGSRDTLEHIGVEVQVDLPGVGKELQDHQVGLGLELESDPRTSRTHTRYRTCRGWIVSRRRSRKRWSKRKRSG